MSDARKLLNALGNVDEKFIEEAARSGPVDEKALDAALGIKEVRVKKKINWKLWVGSVAAIAAIAVGIGFAGGGIDRDMKSESAVERQSIAYTTATAAAEENAVMEDAVPEEFFAADDISDLSTETAAVNEPAAESGLILSSLDNSDYLAKCASDGLVAGAPEYPETLRNPSASFDEMDPDADWDAYSAASSEYYNAKRARQSKVAGYEEPLKAFTETTAKQFLIGQEDNTVYSPLNVYMALSMLAELTEGESRMQILDLLDLADIEAVREEARKLWLANYTDDGLTTLLLGSGVWLEEEFDVNYSALATLVDKYYAFYVVGSMQSEEMAQSFRDWLSTQTGGLLDDFISAEKFDPETILALASTIYYKAHWQDVFQADATKDAVFHAAGGDQTVPFMNEVRSGSISTGSNFTSTFKNMAGGERMHLFLPDEGVSTDEVLENEQFWEVLAGDDSDLTEWGVIVTLSVPKFDVSSGAELSEGLRALGVNDVFDPVSSDFSPLSNDDGLYVGKVSHNARVKIDEEGIEAAAYTAMMLCGSTMPTKYADFICDRPFIFVITNSDGAVLFMGTVSSIQ